MTMRKAIATIHKLHELYGQSMRPAKKLTKKGDDLDPWRTLIAIILSSGVRDANVEMAMPGLMEKYPDPKTLASADQEDVERLVHSTGYFRQKAKAIIATSKDLVEKFGGNVPDSMEDLLTLKGVGRKSASVVLAVVFDHPAVAVDTHVIRVTNRMGLLSSFNPVTIEQELKEKLPPHYWKRASIYFVLLGRDFCDAKKPNCTDCPVEMLCRKRF